jgi:hypothetical protein
MPKSLKTSERQPRADRKPKPSVARPVLSTYEFTLVYPGYLEDLSDDDLDALYEAGCADALVGSCEGEITMDFSRQATSFRVALLSAMHDVEKAGLDLELHRVEPI